MYQGNRLHFNVTCNVNYNLSFCEQIIRLRLYKTACVHLVLKVKNTLHWKTEWWFSFMCACIYLSWPKKVQPTSFINKPMPPVLTHFEVCLYIITNVKAMPVSHTPHPINPLQGAPARFTSACLRCGKNIRFHQHPGLENEEMGSLTSNHLIHSKVRQHHVLQSKQQSWWKHL